MCNSLENQSDVFCASPMLSIHRQAEGVKGVILKYDRVLVLVKPNGALDLPGGRVEYGESCIDSLEREILEETGLKTNIHCPIAFWTINNRFHRLIQGVTFLCECFRKTHVRLRQEHKAFAWRKPAEISRLEFSQFYGLNRIDFQNLSDWQRSSIVPELPRTN